VTSCRAAVGVCAAAAAPWLPRACAPHVTDPCAAAATSETLGACARFSSQFNSTGQINPVTLTRYLAPTTVTGNKPPDESAGGGARRPPRWCRMRPGAPWCGLYRRWQLACWLRRWAAASEPCCGVSHDLNVALPRLPAGGVQVCDTNVQYFVLTLLPTICGTFSVSKFCGSSGSGSSGGGWGGGGAAAAATPRHLQELQQRHWCLGL
jgi:hypothetical protein